MTEAQNKASKKYRKNNIERCYLELNKNTDKDILDKLNSLPKGTKSTYIKDLIRQDIKAPRN